MEGKENKQQGGAFQKVALAIILSIAIMIVISLVLSCFVDDKTKQVSNVKETKKTGEPKIEEMFLTPNKYSRPQIELKKIKGIVVHYTANPGSTAKDNRNYFENLKNKKNRYASSHYVIGLKGEIVQCIPLTEISYASNDRNSDTVSIECCHKDTSGKFNKKTYQSLVELVAWLCGQYNLKSEDIIRHYDVTGKQCPKYYVEHEDEWEQFKKDIFEYINGNADEEEKK